MINPGGCKLLLEPQYIQNRISNITDMSGPRPFEGLRVELINLPLSSLGHEVYSQRILSSTWQLLLTIIIITYTLQVRAAPLLVGVVLTVSVGSIPCSSPTCDRAGTPAGPIRTDKIVSCSYICHASKYFSSFYIYKWISFHLGKWMCLSKWLTLLLHSCNFHDKWRDLSCHTQPVVSKWNIVHQL